MESNSLQIALTTTEREKAAQRAPQPVKMAIQAICAPINPKDAGVTWREIAIMEIGKATTRLGQNEMPQERYRLMVEDLADYLERKCQRFNPSEVALAFKLGATGEFGEVPNHVTIKLFIAWLSEYETNQRREAMHLIRKYMKAARQEDPPIDKEKFIEYAYERWKKDGTQLGLSVVYLRAVEIGNLKPTAERKWKAITEVIEQYDKQMRGSRGYLSVIAKERIKQIKEIQIGNGQSVPGFVKIDAQAKIVIQDLFEKWKSEGK